ncbi:MAG: HAD family hydrolase [Synergistetes bacterium]|nr:HAD family hydrolase [Synergistota bacterium]MCX8128372.1 HAD family hydrolase [Synergistota bacterium]MDW8192970.1 HAD family hydrolase [Synergistota bacterium]
MVRAAFIDRDGTILDNMGYLNHPERVKLLDRVALGIKLLREAGWKIVVVTNQGGIERGYYTHDILHLVNMRMLELLWREGAIIDALYYSPFVSNAPCKKPNPGMIERAVRELGIDLRSSFVVGDQLMDLELANRVGCAGIFVLTGFGLGFYDYMREKVEALNPLFIGRDLLEVAEWVVNGEGSNYFSFKKGGVG